MNSASRAMKLILACRSGGQPSQADLDVLIDLEPRAHRLGDEEANLEIARRQQRDHALAGIHHLARAEIDLFHRAAGGREHLALGEVLLGLAERVPRGLDIGGRRIDHVGAAWQLGRGDALLGLGHRGLVAVVLGDGVVELRLGGPAFVVQRLRTLEIVGRPPAASPAPR